MAFLVLGLALTGWTTIQNGMGVGLMQPDMNVLTVGQPPTNFPSHNFEVVALFLGDYFA